MAPGIGFDHLFGWLGHLEAEISIIHLLKYFCSGEEGLRDGNALIALVVGKVILV
jgi:hypothetical protein